MTDLKDLRENYELGELLEGNIHQDPMQQFSIWMEDAIKSDEKEPNSMVLSTIR